MKEYIKYGICLLLAIILAPLLFKTVALIFLVLICLFFSGVFYTIWKVIEFKKQLKE